MREEEWRTEEVGKGREGRRDGREWEENGSRNLAGASKGTPGNAKCVAEILNHHFLIKTVPSSYYPMLLCK